MPYVPLIGFLIVLPFIGLALVADSKGILKIDSNKNDPRPSMVAYSYEQDCRQTSSSTAAPAVGPTAAREHGLRESRYL